MNDEGDEESNGDGEPSGAPIEPHTLNYARPGAAQAGMKMVTIATFGNSWEAHLAAGKLEAAGVPAALADENVNSIGGGLYDGLTGGIKLQVPQQDVERAMEALPSRVRMKQYPCPKCGSTETHEIDFTPGMKILFLCMLGIPYLFVLKSRFCPKCQNVWNPATQEEAEEAEEPEEDRAN
jgi:ribosomal protein S27AE